MPLPAAARLTQLAAEHLRAGRFHEAEPLLRDALRQNPADVAALINLSVVLIQFLRFAEAEEVLLRAAQLRPEHAGVQVNLGHVARRTQRVEQAAACFRRAIELDPRVPSTHVSLGSACRELGLLDEAVACFRQALALRPDYREAHSNLCYVLHFHSDVSPEECFAEHRRWAQRFADPLLPSLRPHDNPPDPGLRLRVGYVSPHLGEHVVGFFMEPVLQEHDRGAVEVFCYSDADPQDPEIVRRRQSTDVWRDTKGLSDAQLADVVRADRIDVLVDLTLHMAGSRLGAFAHKPAPVQATWLAYCGTSGMRQMDYCIADEFLAPPGRFEHLFAERLIRLSGGYWCYSPSRTGPATAPPPVATRGHVTFGSLNSFSKLNDRVLRLWAEIIEAVPGSRLVLHAHGGAAGRPSLLPRLTGLGLPADRVEVVAYQPRDAYLALYNSIDVALDPFPYDGGTTSLDALWMGVPLATLAGGAPVGRAGVTLLRHVGLPDLIGDTPGAYVRIATGLARDVDRLAKLRGTLRDRLERSPLMNRRGFTRALEDAYRTMWQAWCESIPTDGRMSGGP